MRNFIIVLLVAFSLNVQSQDKVKWLTFEEAIELSSKTPKPILMDLYTDWCGWCKRMDKTTYSNGVIAAYINKNFYPVKFDGEEKKDITFKGKVFTYKNPADGRRGRGYHELAAAILKGNLSYPSTAFFDDKQQLIQVVPGYQTEKQFEKIIAFFNDDNYKKTPWKDFEKKFKSSI